jgi:integrase
MRATDSSSISSTGTAFGVGKRHSCSSRTFGARRFGLPVESQALLKAYLAVRRFDGCRYLLRSRRVLPSPLSGGEINRLFGVYAKAAGLPEDRQHVHVLRHSIGVHLANVGWDAADVQDWLGHREIASTMVYFRITNKRREARYEMLLGSPEIARTAQLN